MKKKINQHEHDRIALEKLGKNPKCPVCKTILGNSIIVPYWLVCSKCNTISNPEFTYVKPLSEMWKDIKTRRSKKKKILKRKIVEPYIVVNKKKHPFGKPITIYLNNLRMWITVSHLAGFGRTKSGKVGLVNAKPDDITIFFDTKDESGWMHLNINDATRLSNALNILLKTDKNGYAKRVGNQTGSSFNITKHRRYK